VSWCECLCGQGSDRPAPVSPDLQRLGGTRARDEGQNPRRARPAETVCPGKGACKHTCKLRQAGTRWAQTNKASQTRRREEDTLTKCGSTGHGAEGEKECRNGSLSLGPKVCGPRGRACLDQELRNGLGVEGRRGFSRDGCFSWWVEEDFPCHAGIHFRRVVDLDVVV